MRGVGGAATVTALGCSRDREYTERDRAVLDRRVQAEREVAGRGRLGALVFRGYRGLAELPWFELDAAGRLRLAARDLPPAVDIHAHLGFSFGPAPALDLLASTLRVEHLLDCDADDPGCRLDLDVYANENFDEDAEAALQRELLRQATIGGGRARTHTIPNLLDEMDAVGVGRAALLPIAPGLPFASGEDVAERWAAAVERSGAGDRLIPFGSVHPRSGNAVEILRRQAAAGVRGVKLHPEMQRFRPDDPEAMSLYDECRRLGLVVVFHAGRSGIEPEWLRPYAVMRHYEPAVADFPDVQFVFGHAGARDVEDAVAIARRHPNVWLGLSSVGASVIDRLLADPGPERLLFGSDWPFYHLALTLAKLLLATRGGRVSMREPVLRGNAVRMFAAAGGIAGAARGPAREGGR